MPGEASGLVLCSQRTDVFVGMHSDVWTNAIFLRDEAAAVQLLPYGWECAPGSRKPLIRGNSYQAVVVRCLLPAGSQGSGPINLVADKFPADSRSPHPPCGVLPLHASGWLAILWRPLGIASLIFLGLGAPCSDHFARYLCVSDGALCVYRSHL